MPGVNKVLASSCRPHWGFPCAPHWWQLSAHDFHRVTSPCGSAIVQKEMATLQPPGPVEETDKGILRSRQHSGIEPASTFTPGALDPEWSDIIGLGDFYSPAGPNTITQIFTHVRFMTNGLTHQGHTRRQREKNTTKHTWKVGIS